MPENELQKFFEQDLDKPGVTGLAKKHERLILFIAAMIGVIGVVIAYQKRQTQGVNATNTNPNLSSGGAGGSTGNGTSTGTTISTPITSTLSLAENFDNSVAYAGGQSHASSFGLGAFGGGLLSGFGGSISDAHSSSSYTQGQANQTSAVQGTVSGTSEDINSFLNSVEQQQGTYAQRLQGSEALLALEEKGGKQ